MSETIPLRFRCGGCAKSYPWKPELTRKRVKCKCGSVTTVPDLTPPPAAAADDPPVLPDDADILAMVDAAPTGASQSERLLAAVDAAAAEPKKKSKSIRGGGGGVPVAAVVAAGAPGRVLDYRQGPTQQQRQRAKSANDALYDLKRDVYWPTGLIVGSLVAYYGWIMIHHGTGLGRESLAAYALGMGLLLLVKTVLMVAGAFIVAPLAGVSFGPIGTAVLKLAALAVAPDVLATILEQAIGSPGAGLLAGAVALAVYWGLMSLLFSMDAAEAWGVVVLFGVLRWILTFMLTMVVLNLFLSGSSLPAGLGGPSSAAGPAATRSAIAYDEKVEEMADVGLIEEGRAYIKRTGRQQGMMETIDTLYAAGAKDVSFALAKDINGKSTPLSLVVKWPRDAKVRQDVRDALKKDLQRRAKLREQHHPDWGPQSPSVVPDEGGAYVEVPLGE